MSKKATLLRHLSGIVVALGVTGLYFVIEGTNMYQSHITLWLLLLNLGIPVSSGVGVDMLVGASMKPIKKLNQAAASEAPVGFEAQNVCDKCGRRRLEKRVCGECGFEFTSRTSASILIFTTSGAKRQMICPNPKCMSSYGSPIPEKIEIPQAFYTAKKQAGIGDLYRAKKPPTTEVKHVIPPVSVPQSDAPIPLPPVAIVAQATVKKKDQLPPGIN